MYKGNSEDNIKKEMVNIKVAEVKTPRLFLSQIIITDPTTFSLFHIEPVQNSNSCKTLIT